MSEYFKCGYCSKGGHSEEYCPTRKSDRRFEILIGFIPFVVSGFLFVVGGVVGFLFSSFWRGFLYFKDSWPWAKTLVFGKKEREESTDEEFPAT